MKRTTIDPALAAELLGLADVGLLRPAELVRDIVRERFGLTIEEMAELEPRACEGGMWCLCPKSTPCYPDRTATDIARPEIVGRLAAWQERPAECAHPVHREA